MLQHKFVVVMCCFAVVLGTVGITAGCGNDTGGEEKGQTMMVAGGIGDGEDALNPAQTECPVCGSPIQPGVHVDTEQGRVYFDKEECRKEWNENPDEYKTEMMERVKEMRQAGQKEKEEIKKKMQEMQEK